MKRIAITAASLVLALSPALALAQDAADPARLAAARTTVDFIFPNGTYARVMDKTMDSIMGSMLQSTQQIPLRDLAAMSGKSDEELAALGNGTLKEVMAILDPAFEQRMSLAMRAMMGEMAKLMTQTEPAVRDGLASAYAKRYNATQLAELNTFFATPTGRAYAADSMVIFMDPDVMKKMQEFVPTMMKAMPAIVEKAKAATASLPEPRKPQDLSPPERTRLAKLLGIPEDELDSSRAGGLVPAD